MSEDIVQRMRFWSETRNNQPTAWNLDCADAADEIERLRKENRQLRERSTEAVVAWINETIKRAGEARILKDAKDGV